MLIAIWAASLAWQLFDALQSLETQRHRSMRWLLQSFALLSSFLSLLQLPILRFCAQLLGVLGAGRGRRGGPGAVMESIGLVQQEEVQELLHVDLSRTPPESEPGAPRAMAAHHVEELGRGAASGRAGGAAASRTSSSEWSEVWSRNPQAAVAGASTRAKHQLSALKLT